MGGMQKGFDFTYRAEIRKIIGHTNTSSVDYLYTPVDLGGCGCVSAWNEYRIQSIVQFLRMLTANDEFIIQLAKQVISELVLTTRNILN